MDSTPSHQPAPPKPGEPLHLEIEPQAFTPFLAILLLLGILVTGAGTAGIVLDLAGFNDLLGPYGFLPISFLMMASGLVIFWVGLRHLLVRVTLDADSGGLSVASEMLFFRRERHFPLPVLRDLKARVLGNAPDDLSLLAEILVCLDTGRRKRIVSRYGAEEIMRDCEALRRAIWPSSIGEGKPPGPPVGGYLSWTKEGQATRIRMSREPVGQVGAGSVPGGIFIFVFATVLCGTIAAGFRNDRGGGGDRVFPVAFCAVAIVLMVKALRRAREEADILIDGGQLCIEIGPGKPRRYIWKQEEVESIRVTSSAWAISGTPIFELCIALANAKPVKLFTGRDIEDLHWLAETLERLLSIRSSADYRSAFFASLSAEDSPGTSWAAIDTALAPTGIRRTESKDALICEIPATTRKIRWLRKFDASADILLTREFLQVRWEAIRRGEAQYSCENINGVRCEGNRDRDLATHQLEIDLKDGRRVFLLEGFKKEELEALATVFRLALGLEE